MYLFVARATSNHEKLNAEETRQWLRDSLEITKNHYVECYGPMLLPPSFLTFIRGSNEPIGAACAPFMWIREKLEEAEREGKYVYMILNGWDGLTTDTLSFFRLFSGHVDRVRIRVYADDPRYFYGVSVRQANDFLIGDFEADLDRGELFEESTARFIWTLQRLHACKFRLSEGMTELLSLSHHRNTPHQFKRNLEKHPCTDCDQVFETGLHLAVHRRNNHHGETYKCRYCGLEFNRKDPCVRHEKESCPKRPGATEFLKAKPKRRTKRKLGTERSSDGGYLLYNSLTPDLAKSLPPLDGANPVADLYKGEMYCRWSGCRNITWAYADHSKLMRHYRLAHQVDLPGGKNGFLIQADQDIEDRGLEWLARCAERGIENAGERPLRRRSR